MNHSKFSAMVPLVLLAIGGCGGGNGPFTGSQKYQGSFATKWTCPASTESGTISMTVDGHSQVIGTFTNASESKVGTLRGAIDEAQNLTGTITYTDKTTQPVAWKVVLIVNSDHTTVFDGDGTVGSGAGQFTIVIQQT